MDQWVESTGVGSSTHSTTLAKAYHILMTIQTTAIKGLAKGVKRKRKGVHGKKQKGESPTRSSPRHQPPTKASPDKTQPDSVVKQLFSSPSKTRRSSRKKNKKTNPPLLLFSPPRQKSPLLFHLRPRPTPPPPAALSDTTSDLGKTAGDCSRSDLGKTKADKAKEDTSKSKANEDYLPPLSNKRKDMLKFQERHKRLTRHCWKTKQFWMILYQE
jgi:hypothetical protein